MSVLLLAEGEPANIDWLERLLKLASNYGISLVITVLVIVLAVVLCYLALKHIPRLVDASIASQDRVATAVEGLSETMGAASLHLGEVRKDTQVLLSAADTALSAFADAKGVAKTKHDIPSDVFDKFEKSRDILRQRGFQT